MPAKPIFEANGYEVQTTRVSSQIWDEARDVKAILKLESDAQALGIDFLNLGTILPEKRHTKTHLAHIADVIVQSETLFATVTLTTQSRNVIPEITENTADIIRQIAHQTEAGLRKPPFRSTDELPTEHPLLPSGILARHQDELRHRMASGRPCTTRFHGCTEFRSRLAKPENRHGSRRTENCRACRNTGTRVGHKVCRHRRVTRTDG